MANAPGKIFVGGLSKITTNDSLYAFFSAYGGLKEANVMMNQDPMTGMMGSRGFGFVVFEDPAIADEVVSLGRVTIDEKSVEVKKIEAKTEQAGAQEGIQYITAIISMI